MSAFKTRVLLCSTAAVIFPAAVAAILAPSAAQAQTVCAGTLVLTGTTITCVDGSNVTSIGTTDAAVVVPSAGLVASSTIAQVTNVTGTIATTADATPAVDLTSANDLTFSLIGTAATIGVGSNGVVLRAADDIVANVQNVTTAGVGSDALTATALGDLDIEVGSITTLADNADGLVLTADNIIAVCGRVATAGNNAIAINANATATLDLTCGTVQTTGDVSDAVVLTGETITANLGTVTTDGLDSDAITAVATGNLNLTADSVTTLQNDSNGLTLTADNIVAVCGTVTTAGNNSIGVSATAAALVNLTCGTVRTTGDAADAVVLAGGDIVADLGIVSTDGLDSDAVTATATGDLDITTDAVTTLQRDSNGLTLNAGTIASVCGTVSTAATNSIGIDATATGTVDLRCVAVTTTGANSTAVDINGGTVTNAGGTLGTITATGAGSAGLLVDATGPVNLTVGAVTSAQEAILINALANPVVLGCGNIATVEANAPAVSVNGTGTIDVRCGNITTAGNASDGLQINGGASPLTPVTAVVGNVITAGIDSDAVQITDTGNVAVTTGNLTTTGADSTALLIAGPAGVVAAVCANVTTSGANSTGVDITATGSISLGCGAIRTTGPAADAVVLTGGAITGTIGPITATGTGSEGVVVTATGPVNLTTGAVATTDNGITIGAGPNNVTLSCGNVTTTEANATATTVNSTGTINVTCGIQTTGGANSDGLQINGGAGPITATIAGAVTAGADSEGVDIAGTGPVIFTNAGTIRTGGPDSTGVEITGVTTANAQCGNITTTGSNSPAFDLAANGNTTVTCGIIDTSGANSDGINITNAAGTTTVTGGTTTTTGMGSIGIDVATLGTGTVTVNTGTVTSSGVGSPGAVRVAAADCATVNVNVTNDLTSTTGAAVLASSACLLNVTTTAGSSVVGTTSGINATSGTGTTITLNDSVRATAGPAIDANGASAVVNVNAAGSIIGRIDLTPNNDTLNNGGLFDVIGISDFGAGVDVVNNLATGMIRSTAGPGALANCETFNNSGTITMIDGAANDTLAVCANYVGTGAASLGIDVEGGAGGLLADRLIVSGNASGSTRVTLNFLPSAVIIDPDGVIIVDAGTATGNPFTLNPFNVGLINFGLQQRGADTFLASTADARIFEAARLNTMAQDMWYQSADVILSCAASRRNDFGHKDTKPIGVCAQLYSGSDRSGDRDRAATVFGTNLTYSDRTKTKRRGAQIDVGFSNGMFHAGVTAGYSRAEADPDTGTDFDIEGHNIGVYAQFGAGQGFYAGILAKRDNYDARMFNATFIPVVKVDGKSTGIDGEVGFRTTGMGPLLDFNVGLSHVRTKFDDFQAGFIDFDADSRTSTRGRIGVRAGWTGQYAPFVDAKLFHDFRGDNDIEVRSGSLIDTISARGRGTWGRLEAGVGGAVGGGPLLSVWTDLGDVKGWGIRGGFRF